MFSLLAKLRRKPERVRRQITFLVAASLTGMIVLLWLVSVAWSVREPAGSPALRSAEEESSPLKVFSDTVGAFMRDTEAVVRELKDGFSSFTEPQN